MAYDDDDANEYTILMRDDNDDYLALLDERVSCPQQHLRHYVQGVKKKTKHYNLALLLQV